MYSNNYVQLIYSMLSHSKPQLGLPPHPTQLEIMSLVGGAGGGDIQLAMIYPINYGKRRTQGGGKVGGVGGGGESKCRGCVQLSTM